MGKEPVKGSQKKRYLKVLAHSYDDQVYLSHDGDLLNN